LGRAGFDGERDDLEEANARRTEPERTTVVAGADDHDLRDAGV